MYSRAREAGYEDIREAHLQVFGTIDWTGTRLTDLAARANMTRASMAELVDVFPLGAAENLLPACKNLGVTHITNGCYRLHPVEWNIGEAAG